MSEQVIFKPIPGFDESRYKAGSDGKVYSNKRNANFPGADHEWFCLREYESHKGYLYVSLYRKKSIRIASHRVICLAFNGTPIDKSMQVRHLDGNPKNNKPENLQWGTYAENYADSILHNRRRKGEKHPKSSLTDFDRSCIKWAYENGVATQVQLAKALGVSTFAIHYTCTVYKKTL